MSHLSSRGRRSLATLLASGLAAGAVMLPGAAPASADPTEAEVPKSSPAEALGAEDAKLLAEAEASGKPTVTVMVATDTGEAGAVAGELEALGATVSRSVDKLGYVLAKVPTGAVVRAAQLPRVAALDLDRTLRLPDPAEGLSTGAAAKAAAGPGATTPAKNPYLPTVDTGSVDFKKKNPAYDGRGITIGVMDSGVDLDHPALQTTSTGERKIVDWFTATDPLEDATWRRMTFAAAGPSFTVNGAAFTAPAGSYFFNFFYESTTAASEPGGDVNRDGDTTDAFGVLYDPATHDIRIDTDLDRSFTDETVMRPYKEKFQVGHFGTDNPATAIAEHMPFVVEYREDVQGADYVSIGIVESAHGTHVAGIAAGSNLFGNEAFDGQAPGAKIVSGRACSWGGGCTYAALTDGMVDMVVNRHVDVINMSIGGLSGLNDGRNAWTMLYNRLINDYGVQMFISAGNSGPGLNTLGDPSTAADVVSVGSSISKETWLANYGSVVGTAYGMHPYSSRGPREDGGFKPNIVAPGSAISSVPTWQPGQPGAQAGYALPPGYAMFNGTSMASPQAAGAAALLLSAARANDRGLTPAQLRRGIYTSAKFIKDVTVYEQGYGLFDVEAAWKLLKTDLETRTYTSTAPVCTPLSDLIGIDDEPTPDQGPGIYNRCAASEGGHKPGQAKTYQIKITRTSGPARAVTHRLSWVGNDGTFNAPTSVSVPLNRTITVSVTAKPSAGAHAALLKIDDPGTPVIDYEVMATVVAANELPKPAYSYRAAGKVDRNDTQSYFVNVPAGAGALQVNLSGLAAGSQTRFIAIDPNGIPRDSTSSVDCYTNYEPVSPCKGIERDYRNPAPGIWEIEVESRRTSPMLSNPYTITAAVQGVTLTPALTELASVEAGVGTPLTWTAKNTFGPIRATGQGGALGSVLESRPTIADGEVLEYTITVPAGTTRLDVAIGDTSDPIADLDLFLYRGDSTTFIARSADGDSEESVSLVNPAAGTYRVEIDGYAVPAGTTSFDYRDAYYSPALGSIAVPQAYTSLANGATLTVNGTITAATVPPAGRSLTGELQVVTDQGAVVGTAIVTVASVQ
ncbi:subtilisin family serine protease [Catenuloplanes nepalensis]|uniref:Subtilisin family serine protease n=1 Tax=Catenuloplanes nepalensis TaxID=587533 RepID=A0ABT9MPQ5_9ACTN|nr:S8 family serine peptidase [Catenuloplanes nepalensis]MDP9793369.1 subtilisin family serine protease [Catenuloplanes nepalensis]